MPIAGIRGIYSMVVNNIHERYTYIRSLGKSVHCIACMYMYVHVYVCVHVVYVMDIVTKTLMDDVIKHKNAILVKALEYLTLKLFDLLSIRLDCA